HVHLVILHLEVDLGIHGRVQVVSGDDLLPGGIHHLFSDVHRVELLETREDPVESRTAEPLEFSEKLDQHPVGGPDDPDPEQEVAHDQGRSNGIDLVLCGKPHNNRDQECPCYCENDIGGPLETGGGGNSLGKCCHNDHSACLMADTIGI